MFRRLALATAAALVITLVSAAPSVASPPPDDDGGSLAVYTGTVDAAGMRAIVESGVDRHDVFVTPNEAGGATVEVILAPAQAAQLAQQGAVLEPKAPSSRARTFAVPGDGVFRPYSGEGGIQQELASQAADNPTISKLVTIGKTVTGQNIDAVKVTRNAQRSKDGSRPTTVYISAQHAREWITPEMTRRLLAYVLEQYGTDPTITNLVNTTELWFVPVANPDGYDYTFTDDRLWRKNLRDNNGDGTIESGDGVDLNRNYPTRWGYDNEGSSPNPASETYRGPSAASEPETQAMIDFFGRITPEFFVNYHSAAELLLHGIGWQVATPSPDDVIYESMVGDDADPAIPTYDPDISAELYTTNGDTDAHMEEAYGTLGFTPEMATCQTASNVSEDDEWDPADCESVFNFPDSEALIQAEFEKNIPFAIAVAQSAKDPNDPVSVVGRDTPDLVADPFDVSYGDPQAVAVTAKRDLLLKLVNYRVNGGRTQVGLVREWQGGERYGDENDVYYAEYRGTVRGTKPGDSVEVWFSAFPSLRDVLKTGFTRIESEHFTYSVAQDTGNAALVIANEDYTGVNPEETPRNDGPKYLDEHVAALEANGVTPDVWDVDTQGIPHPLGVLSHYQGAVWYLGDNRLTQDPEDALTDYFGNELPDLSVAERQQYLTLAVRDWLNEGGKLVYDGETTAYYGIGAAAFGGIFYGLDGAPEQDCVVTNEAADCLLLADDFTQYYLGVYDRTPLEAEGVLGTAPPLEGLQAAFGGPAVADNPVDEAGQFVVTSDVLPVEEFPQFESTDVAQYTGASGPFLPVEGEYAAVATHTDDGYQRLARTFDLTGVSASDAPAFEAQLSYDTEEGYDHVIVEARPVGTDDWTTLPDANGGTTSQVPADCDQGFLLEEHPQLERYLTLGDPCLPAGTTGEWNSFTGSSDGWTAVSFDLSAYAGEQVELVVSYVTDPFSGGYGVVLDDTALVVAGDRTQVDGFEGGLGAWEVLGAPESSPGNASDWALTEPPTAAVATPDTITFGFGLEQLESDAARADAVGRALAYLLG